MRLKGGMLEPSPGLGLGRHQTSVRMLQEGGGSRTPLHLENTALKTSCLDPALQCQPLLNRCLRVRDNGGFLEHIRSNPVKA